ncbi:MAG: hypothetical protein JO332_18990 [Planctomycetaceae bacterium]|nr:hypothetical protein [Planctomycetaceae bacterium]
MPETRAPGWRFILTLWVLFLSIAGCCWLIWERRVAWHVVETLPGRLQCGEDLHGAVTYAFDPPSGRLTFLDTRESFVIPEQLRSNLELVEVHPSRCGFVFYGGASEKRFWSLRAGREVPLPSGLSDSWKISADGTRLLTMELPEDRRCFRILGLDGAVIRERRLPPEQRPVHHHVYSPDGAFLVLVYADYSPGDRIRIYEMASERAWPFSEHLCDISEDGTVWLRDAAAASDRSPSTSLRAVRLADGAQLWKLSLPDGVSGATCLGRDRLAVDLYGPNTCAIVEARTGRSLVQLEGRQSNGAIRSTSLRLHQAGPRCYVTDSCDAWSAETGQRLSLKGDVPSVEFFDDGRRALIDVKCGWPGRIVDVESGAELFAFREPGAVVGPNVRIVGNRVVASGVDRASGTAAPLQVWERRYPEGWKGHLQRPELFGAIFLGAALLSLWANRPR